MRIAKFLEPALKKAALRALVSKRGNTLSAPIDPAEFRRVLIYRPERFGDVLATLPLIRTLKRHHPHWQITLWSSDAGEQVCQGEPDFAAIKVVADSGWEALSGKAHDAFDLAIDMVMHDSVNALLRTSRAVPNGLLVGWGKSALAGWYDWAPALVPSHRYNPHLALDLVALTGISADDSAPVRLTFTKTEMDWAAMALNDPSAVVINISAGDPARRWPESRWAEVTRYLCMKTPYRVRINAIGSDRDIAARLSTLDPKRVAPLPPTDWFRNIACVVSRAAMFISPNTSLVHISAGVGVPTVTLEPPVRPVYWDWIPPGAHVIAIPSGPPDGIAAIRPAQIISAIGALIKSRAMEAAQA
jgi:heptosyltransferase-3